jgi:proline racemase
MRPTAKANMVRADKRRTGIGERSHSLRPCGTTGSTRLASLMDRSTAKASKAYIEQFLVPTLSSATLVIMDNLGSHLGHAVRRAIRSVGARLLFRRPTQS